MNAVKAARVTPTPTAPTYQVHMCATVPLVFMEMILTVKVKQQLLLISLTSMEVKEFNLKNKCIFLPEAKSVTPRKY